MSRKIALKAKWVFPMDTVEEKVLVDHVVLVDGSRIEKIVPAADFSSMDSSNYEVREYPGNSVILPGFINTHTHVGMTLLRGYSDDVELQTWLTQNIWPAEAEFMREKYRDEDGYHGFVRVSTALACDELLRHGTTTIVDMYFHSESSNVVFAETGLRVYNGPSVLDFGDGTVDAKIEEAVAYFNSLKQWEAKLPENRRGLIKPGAFPHSCYMVGEASLKKILDECGKAYEREGWGKKDEMVFAIHMHESEKEVQDFNASHNGESAVQVLQRVGAISKDGPKFVAAHSVHLTDDEVKIMAQQHGSVAHCPRSNMKLASGVCCAQHYLDNGVNVGLGTDSCASNNALNMLGEIQTAALVGKVARVGGGPTAVSAWTALRLATINGAKAIGREHELGSVTEGKLADLVVVDLTNQPAHLLNPVSELVYGCNNAGFVKDVLINGEDRVKDGRCVTMPTTLGKEDFAAAVHRWHVQIEKFRDEYRRKTQAEAKAVEAATTVETMVQPTSA